MTVMLVNSQRILNSNTDDQAQVPWRTALQTSHTNWTLLATRHRWCGTRAVFRGQLREFDTAILRPRAKQHDSVYIAVDWILGEGLQ